MPKDQSFSYSFQRPKDRRALRDGVLVTQITRGDKCLTRGETLSHSSVLVTEIMGGSVPGTLEVTASHLALAQP